MERISILEAAKRVGEHARVAGWVSVRRDHGKLIFIDLRDGSGLVQCVFRPDDVELHSKADTLRPEWVIAVEGEVRERPKGMENPDLASGKVELAVEKLEDISEAMTPPIAVDTDGKEIGEEHRLKYRYLDLRRERLKQNLMLRDRAVAFIREFLRGRGFVEIETPMLTKSTPEGARDYVVPSRLHPGHFYALPQSPQQYKQLLMVAGFERYFQIARCFRDEDTRGDRQPEFTQLDIEMAFVEREDVLMLIESLFTDLTERVAGKKIFKKPFPRLTHAEAVERFSEDKFDLREPKDPKVMAFAWVVDFPIFEKTETQAIAPSHHPFTAPQPEDIALLASDPFRVRSWQYDLVLNGYEIGGGSMRITNPELQKKIFRILGYSDPEIQAQFGHLLEAYNYGAPPHGGIAIGIDRLIAVFQNESSVREVMAFPKTGDGRDLMMDAPAELEPSQLKELGLEIKKPRA